MSKEAKAYSVDVITSVDGALKLLQRQKCLLTPTKIVAPSLESYWLSAFIRHYGRKRKLAITAIMDNGRCRAVIPFQKLTPEILAFVCDETSDYNDILYDGPEIGLIRSAVAQLFLIGAKRIVLSRIPDDSQTIALLQTTAKEMALKISIDVCDYMPVVTPVCNAPIDVWPGIHASRIAKLKRQLRALSRSSTVRFSLIESQEELESLLPLMMNLHIDRWMRRGQISKFLDPRRRDFTDEICKEALRRGTLFAPVMFIDGSLASYCLCFRGGDAVFEWNTSFAFSHRHWSPGALLLLDILSRSQEHAFAKYNLLRGEESYKYFWTNQREKTTTVILDRI